MLQWDTGLALFAIALLGGLALAHLIYVVKSGGTVDQASTSIIGLIVGAVVRIVGMGVVKHGSRALNKRRKRVENSDESEVFNP